MASARSSAHHIRVAVRVRPLRERDGNAAVLVDSGSLRVRSGQGDRSFAYPLVVTGSDQAAAFDALARPLLAQLREGYSCTLLAYGQTGSGKTHTVFGPPGSLTEQSLARAGQDAPPDWGLLPRIALELLASGLGALHASAVEIYQERAYDLLADRAPLSVGSKSAGVQVGGSARASVIGDPMNAGHAGVHPPGCRCGACWMARKEEQAARMAKRDAAQQAPRGRTSTSGAARDAETFATVGETLRPLEAPADVARLALAVEGSRTAVGHALNARSSRSHCLVHLHLTHRSEGRLARRQLLFVDLAGSERIEKSGVEGTARQQAVTINGSLTALGKVIRALGERASHVPYRDSTLTLLLRSSLGGRASTSVVINVAPDAEHAEESTCSLDFGQRMAAVRNTATVVVGQDARAELAKVRALLVESRAALAKMELDGLGEHFAPGAAASEVRSFQENVQRLAAEEAASRQAKAELAEQRAAGASPATIASLEAAVQAARVEAENYRMILLRQKSIKGFYIPAKPGYVAKAAEVRDLEAQLAKLDS